MLVWIGQGLDQKKIRMAEQAVQIDVERLSSQLGVETGAQTSEGMRMIAHGRSSAKQLPIRR